MRMQHEQQRSQTASSTMKVPRNLPSSAQIRQMQTKMLRRMVYYYYYYYLLCGGMKLSMS